MTKRLTKEEFIAKSIKVHGYKYNYDLVEYINSSTKVRIKCVQHDLIFEQRPHSHQQGRGCPICRYESTSINNRKTHEQFVKDAIKVHGNSYSYDISVYVDGSTPMDILCNKHQTVFKQKPEHHIVGSGCPICAKEKISAHIQSLVLTTEQFIEKATKIHGNKYLYHETKYIKSSGKVKIYCMNHKGFFHQTANSHLAGVGCASCAKTGYSLTLAGKLYILRSGDITKIGITNFEVKDRVKTISKSFGAEFTVLKIYEFEDGSLADSLETNVLRILRIKYSQPKAKFQGSSECFLNVDYQELLSVIDQELSKLQ